MTNESEVGNQLLKFFVVTVRVYFDIAHECNSLTVVTNTKRNTNTNTNTNNANTNTNTVTVSVYFDIASYCNSLSAVTFQSGLRHKNWMDCTLGAEDIT